MSRALRFEMSEVVGSSIVWGRNCGEDISIGACFDKFVIYQGGLPEAEINYMSILDGFSFKVKAIEWARKDVDVLPASHTGGLHVAQKSAAIIEDVLACLSDGKYLIALSEG